VWLYRRSRNIRRCRAGLHIIAYANNRSSDRNGYEPTLLDVNRVVDGQLNSDIHFLRDTGTNSVQFTNGDAKRDSYSNVHSEPDGIVNGHLHIHPFDDFNFHRYGIIDADTDPIFDFRTDIQPYAFCHGNDH